MSPLKSVSFDPILHITLISRAGYNVKPFRVSSVNTKYFPGSEGDVIIIMPSDAESDSESDSTNLCLQPNSLQIFEIL